MIDIIIGIFAVGVVAFSVIRFFKRRKKQGCSSCCMDCSKCKRYDD